MRRFLLFLLPVAALWAYGCGDQLTQPQVMEPDGPVMASMTAGTTHLVPPPTGDPAQDRSNIVATIRQARPGDVVMFSPGTYLLPEDIWL